MGRLMTPDPEGLGSTTQDPQSWNMYAYARNNPLRFTDPTGLSYEYCVQDHNETRWRNNRSTHWLQFGLTVVAVRRGNGEVLFNPPSDTELQHDDVLQVLCLPEQAASARSRAGEG